MADGGQLVAVGRDEAGLASWTSTDGVEWERHSVPDPSFIKDMVDDFGPSLYGGTSMGQMAKLGETLFSFGTFWGPIDFYRPVGWRSSDGMSWEFIESESAFYGYGSVTGVRTLGDALIAARATGLIGPAYDLWQWTGETSWQQSNVRSTNSVPIVSMSVAVDDVSALAVGEATLVTDAPQDQWPSHVMAWHSSDGLHWAEVASPIDAALACGVAVGPSGGFVMVGKSADQQISAWSTINGTTWRRSDLATGAHLEGCANVALEGRADVVTAGDELLARATTLESGRIWLSPDGLSWEVQDVPEIRSFVGQAAFLNGEWFVPAAVDDSGALPNVLLHGVPGS